MLGACAVLRTGVRSGAETRGLDISGAGTTVQRQSLSSLLAATDCVLFCRITTQCKRPAVNRQSAAKSWPSAHHVVVDVCVDVLRHLPHLHHTHSLQRLRSSHASRPLLAACC